MFYNFERSNRRQAFIYLLQLLNGIFLLVAIALLGYSAAYTNKLGPVVYSSPFTNLYLSSCLAFQTLQVFRLMYGDRSEIKRWKNIFLALYLVILTICGFIDGVAFTFTPSPAATAISFLIFLDGAVVIASRYLPHKPEAIAIQEMPNGGPVADSDYSEPMIPNRKPVAVANDQTSFQLQAEESVVRSKSRHRNCGFTTLRVFNRILMTIHAALIILSAAGAVELALTYQYTNPGTRVHVTLPSGKVHAINYNCTSVPSSNSSLPTIWLEADAAHGVVDFLGLQTSLALDYGRNSCSYDPPNFGWSDPLPIDLIDFFSYFNPLLHTLGRENEEKVLVGWGAGAENALMHTIENANTTTAFVIMDASPDGIEWMDAKRKNNWTEAQMLDFRASDLAGRVVLARTILGLGVPWGLMPVFNPANSTGYFDQSLYPRYRAQGMKNNIWSYQYYDLLHEAASSIDNYLVNTTAPHSVDVFAIMTYDAGSPVTDNASNEFYRNTKVDMANHIAGGNLSQPVVWCKEAGCSLSFPVNKPQWAAGALMSLGI